MHIREGETSNEIITDKNFFKIQIERGGDRFSYAEFLYDGFSGTIDCEILFHTDFKAKYDFNGELVQVKQLEYIQRKKDS